MAILSLAEIMEAEDVSEKTVNVPQWGGEVVVKSLSHRTMRDIRKSLGGNIESEDDIDENELEKWILIKGLVEPQVDEQSVEQLYEKSTGAIQVILSAIIGSSKIGEEAVKDAEKSLPAEPERVLSVQSGGEPGDDGGASANREVGSAYSL